MLRKRNGIRAMSVAVAPTIGDLLVAVWPRNTAKLAATVFDRSYRTVQDWLQGRCSMSADEFLSRVAERRELRAELVRLLGELDGPDDAHGRGPMAAAPGEVAGPARGSDRPAGRVAGWGDVFSGPVGGPSPATE